MLKRYLGGIAVVLGVVGAAHAQIPANRMRPAFVPNKPFQPTDIQQTSAKSDAAPPPLVAAPAPAPAPAANPYQLPPNIMADINAACGDPAGGCNTCSDGCCDSLCGPPGRFWIGAEWLYWTTKGNFVPPLITRGAPGTPLPAVGSTAPRPGALGTPGTSLLLGNQGVNNEWRSGFRLNGGFWLNQAQTWGIEGQFLFLGQSSESVRAASNGTDIITRPFINNVRQNEVGGPFFQVAPFQDAQLVSFPNVLAGSVTVNSATDFIGGGVNLRRNLLCSDCGRLDLLLGYRYLNLNDTLFIQEDLQGLAGSRAPGSNFVVQDRFRTENHFHGGVIGFDYERRFNRLFLGVRSSVALGGNRTIVDINGATTITNAAGVQTFEGGLLAQPSNIGRYTRDQFAVVPEIGLRLGAQVTDHLRVFGGYNFLYWNNVTRTGEVIDLRVNASQLPPRNIAPVGQQFPVFAPRTTDFWTHGVSVGAELRY